MSHFCGVGSSQSASGSTGESATLTVVQELDPRYSKMVCFNCGIPSHFVGNCVMPKLCFICNLSSHPVHACPEWIKDHPEAAYFGSAGSGLGFYHLDIPESCGK